MAFANKFNQIGNIMSKKTFDDHTFITNAELADRWRITRNALYAARKKNIGVNYIKIQGDKSLILYKLSDVKKYEERHYVRVNSDVLLPSLRKK